MNLNEMQCADEFDADHISFQDNSIYNKEVAVYFRDLEDHLISLIEEHDAIIGAVAWLSNYKILDALSKKEHVSIVVQKEDFLRPESNNKSEFKKTIQKKYNALNSSNQIARYSMSGTLGESLSIGGDPTMDTVRCAGNHNSSKSPSSPRMHNKFMLFCDIKDNAKENKYNEFIPRMVWTGSFNMSYAATQSLENAVLMSNDKIVQAYYREFAQIYAISEPLDWTSEWSEPEYRIGT